MVPCRLVSPKVVLLTVRAFAAPTMATDTPTSYRPDIDGLRALAVLLVMGFHAFPGRVPGGFVGVDVFFAISGYLISGLIIRDIREGHFSLRHFYARRVRRIFPALAVLLVACLVVGGIVLVPTEYADLGLNAAAGAAFVSNLALWAQSGYFAAASELKPLLHLWSLGVEEQFYFAWPLTLVFLFARTKRPWIPVAGIALASFALNLRQVRANPDAAFYSPLTRLWELLIGALLAYQTERARSGADDGRASGGGRVSIVARNAAALLGLILVAVAAMAFDGSQAFPGWRAAVPVVGTALCIAAGREAWINRFVLAHRIPVFFGLISYPLYLWHWPALALIPVLDIAWSASQERTLKLVALGAAVVAAYLTYRWVERPVRRGNVGSIAGLCAAMVVPFLAGMGIWAVDWRASRASNLQQREIARQLEQLRVARAELYRDRRCFLDGDQDEAAFARECVIEVESHRGSGTLLWGDSHAAHLAPGIRARGARAGFAQLSASSCPPILGYSARGRPNCARLNQWVLGWVRENRPATVLLAASWPSYDGYPAVAATIHALKSLGTPRVVVVGPVISFRERVASVLARQSTDEHVPERLPSTRLGRLRGVDSELRALAAGAGAEYVSPLDLVCDRRDCLVAPGGRAETILVFDQSHLTPAGSRYLADRLLAPYVP
jgi:peptidoglycan/LPS O-acetylase OafA/YrhL